MVERTLETDPERILDLLRLARLPSETVLRDPVRFRARRDGFASSMQVRYDADEGWIVLENCRLPDASITLGPSEANEAIRWLIQFVRLSVAVSKKSSEQAK